MHDIAIDRGCLEICLISPKIHFQSTMRKVDSVELEARFSSCDKEVILQICEIEGGNIIELFLYILI